MARARAAHFLLHPELAGSPPNHALITALLELGLDVDLYANGPASEAEQFGPRVRVLPVEFRTGWLASKAAAPSWRRYALLSGTSELPMGVVGVLARLHRRPSVTLADEIRSGSYRGDDSERWKRWCRSGMRRSRLTVVNDPSRVELQRSYAGLPSDHPFIVYPGCFRNAPRSANRVATRAARGIPTDALVLCSSGVFSHGNGGLWVAEALRQAPDLRVWGQLVGTDPLVLGLLGYVEGHQRLHLETRRLGWAEAWSVTAAADVGLVVYLQDAPQFQNMGVSSNRLCMFLSMGVPVVANRQPSFEFIERYDCGVLIERASEIGDAIGLIARRLPEMRENALRCAREHIAAGRAYDELKSALASLIGRLGAGA